MAIVDSKGRFLGKVSILDIGAVLVILLVIIGVLLPSTTGIAQVGSNTKPVEVDVVVRSVVSDTLLKPGDKTNIIIRNQPFGDVKILKVEELPRNVSVPQPDGSVKPLPDPRPEAGLTKDYIVTLAGNAQITKDGPVLSNNKIKIGTRIELEGYIYNFTDLSILNIRIEE